MLLGWKRLCANGRRDSLVEPQVRQSTLYLTLNPNHHLHWQASFLQRLESWKENYLFPSWVSMWPGDGGLCPHIQARHHRSGAARGSSRSVRLVAQTLHLPLWTNTAWWPVLEPAHTQPARAHTSKCCEPLDLWMCRPWIALLSAKAATNVPRPSQWLHLPALVHCCCHQLTSQAPGLWMDPQLRYP